MLLKAFILLVASASLGALGVHLGWDAEASEVSSYPWLLAGCFFIATAGGVLLVVLARGGLVLVDLLMFPGDTGDPPPALYKLPEWYISEGRYDDALSEYLKISKAHPREAACWIGIVTVHVTYLNDLKSARKAARTGLRKLRSPEDKQTLQQHYQQLTGENLKPGWWS